MKDLLPKTLKIGREKKEDENSLREELKVTIERYRAQDFDVTPLKDLEDKSIRKIRNGIDKYLNALKKLNSALTVLKSLEGYGYTKEIEAIIENIKNPDMADKVFQDAEDLKERAFAEHNIKHERVEDTPGARVMKSLQARSKVINGVVGKEDEPLDPGMIEEGGSTEEINTEDFDALLNSMDGLGDDLDLNFNDLESESPSEEPVPEPAEAPVKEEPSPIEEPIPEPAAEPETVMPPVEEEVPPPEEPAAAEEPAPAEAIPEPTPVEAPVNIELLMEKAKDLYRTGDMLDSLSMFEEVLKNDPDSSKAKFMIRRIKQKLQ